MGFGWQEIDKTLDLGYIRVAGLHRECKPAVLFDPPNFRPRTMTHVLMYKHALIGYTHAYEYKARQSYRVLGNFRGTKFSRTQHSRIFAVLNYSRMQNFKFTDLRLDFILVQQYVILYKLCTEK